MSDITISDRLTGLSPAVIHVYTKLVAFTDSATVDDIAQAADVARSSTFKALVALEKRNLAHRNRGIKNGPDRRPDLWHATHTAPAPPFEQPGTREEPVPQTLAAPRSAAPVPDSSHSMREPYRSTAHGSDEKSDASASRRTASSAPPPAQCPAALQPSGVTPATASPGGSRRLARGALRQLVIDHLNAHPGESFTATRISRVIDRSSGAVANALVTLATQGLIERVTDRPRTYRAAPQEPTA
ncbi:helix-turn-helix domain-containing protein [Streptomyces sp. NPDC001093]|uniref:helix-turn-helix domain-containing protein n=1 Tax=Streptomyces sp. NPDC001093 TaxID=3154376 RepID=UPI0033297D32